MNRISYHPVALVPTVPSVVFCLVALWMGQLIALQVVRE